MINLRTSPIEDPAAPAPAGPKKKNNIQAKTVLQVFREGRTTEEGPLVPLSYIGEFKATAVTDETVTLEATMPDLTANVRAAATSTWARTQTCPVDGHEWFASEKPEAMVPRRSRLLSIWNVLSQTLAWFSRTFETVKTPTTRTRLIMSGTK